MNAEVERRRAAEAWIAKVRLGSVAFAIVMVGLVSQGYPAGYEAAAWAVTGALAAGAVAIWAVQRRRLSDAGVAALSLTAVTFDTLVVYGYMWVFTFEPGVPSWGLVYLPVVEAAVRYGVLGGVAQPLAAAPLLAFVESWRSDRFPPLAYDLNYVLLPIGLAVIIGLIVGRLVASLRHQSEVAEARAAEAERLRDRLGRRVDLLEATNRCARALASSLDLDEAFAAFIRELRGLIAFDRASVVLDHDGETRVVAVAGVGETEVYGRGSAWPSESTVIEELRRHGQTVYRGDIEEPRYAEEAGLASLGLRSRVVAPVQVGGRPLGALTVLRAVPNGFRAEEIELLSLLGRLVATAVQNIRTYEAERTTVEELRRLSALRADFVSLVSHELRSPMAAVIGSAQTLRQRWRELHGDQREAFLAVIADETNRLADLIGDVLDTSRIEAGTFSYRFSDVDVGDVVREAAGAAAVAQDEVRVEVEVDPSLPRVRGDRERLRQLLDNLVSNAVKYSDAGQSVSVRASATNGRVRVRVSDRGPGIPAEHQGLVFEKFGRVDVVGGSKPGTGLGLFIARSIAEAHGGSLELASRPGEGATFTVELPAG